MPFLPTRAMIHRDQFLTNVAQAAMQDEANFIAPAAFPLVDSDKLSNQVVTYDTSDFFRDDARPRAPLTESQGGGFRMCHVSYDCTEWAWHHDIADEFRSHADAPVDLDRDGTNYVTQIMRIRRERLFGLNFMAAGVWSTQATGVAAPAGVNQVVQWDDYVNSTPIADCEDLKEAVRSWGGFKPNVAICDQKVWRWLKHHPQLIARYVNTQAVPALTEAQVAEVLGFEKLIVGHAAYTQTREGNPPDRFKSILPRHFLAVYVPPAPSITQPSAGYIFNFTGGNRRGTNIIIERFRLANDAKGDRITGSFYVDMMVMSANLGGIILNVTSR